MMNFYKYQGTGNDFVMIDNREENFPKNNKILIAQLCHRRFGIGADGLILLENDPQYDFRMVYYNSDGRESTMCGNGGRCVVAFAKQLGIIEHKTLFIAVDGEHRATIEGDNYVRLQMKNVTEVEEHKGYVFLNTGSPHHVQWVKEVDTVDVKDEGATIRYGKLYATQGGSNVNFVSKGENGFKVRTYERGVEDETYSCGTGVTAVAIALYHTKQTENQSITLHTRGGDLQVSFDRVGEGYENIYLSGSAQFVFEGTIK
jgi:diaminopimelate epimerase|nr:diaminopimelate epimerase [uncultured Capnocytophaga sp.]